MNVLQKWSAYLYKRCGYAKRKGDQRGLTFVELICAMAILGLVGASVSGIMIVGANSYRRGTTEVELQTEAQLAANQIGDLIIDTTAEVIGDPTPTEASKITVDCSDKRYVVEYNSGAAQLLYSEYNLLADGGAVPVSEGELLAEHVTKFAADVSDFSSSGSIRLSMTLEKDTKAYTAYFTITARNGHYSVTGGGVAAAATVVAPNEIVVEPNQVYPLSATVVGITDKSVTWSISNNVPGTEIIIHEDNIPYLHVSADQKNDMVLTVSTVTMDGAAPLAYATVNVRLRRVNDVTLSGTLASGNALKSGATYRITASLDGTNLARLLGSESDMDYVDPYKLSWSSSLFGADGNEITNTTGYFKLDVYDSYAELTLYQDFDDLNLTIYAKAMHPEGKVGGIKYNKSEIAYDTDVMGEWSLSNRIQITVPGGWARGGNSDMLLENVPDDNLTSYDGGQTSYNQVDLNWWLWKSWGMGQLFDFWQGPMTQGNNGGWGTMQSTDLGLEVQITQGDVLALKEYLTPDKYSYSYPYYVNDWDMGISRMKLEITLHGAHTVQTGVAIFDVPEVAFQFRNSLPSDGEGAWSSDTGSHVVYVTPSDSIDTYTSYFRLMYGWDAGNEDYIAYNRFVGVINDEPGYANDRGYDLTFVNSAGQRFYRPTERHTNMNLEEISSGTTGNRTIAVLISQEEKNNLCAGNGTVIKEIYEYNLLFNTAELNQLYDRLVDWGTDASIPWNMYNSVDGCDGYLEYHFVQPNVQITNHTDNKPPVMFCPTGADAGLVNGFYYMTENARYIVNGTTADYQIKVGGVFTSQYTLTWNGSMWCD